MRVRNVHKCVPRCFDTMCHASEFLPRLPVGRSSDHIKPDARSMRESGIPAKTGSREGQASRSSIVCSIVISFFSIDKPRFSELVSQEQRHLIAT
jgi:hypothetical protein